MSEQHTEYVLEGGAPSIQLRSGTVEARLVEKYRQARREWLDKKRPLFIMLTAEGAIELFEANPFGRIPTK